jgi:hypothetical protein
MVFVDSLVEDVSQLLFKLGFPRTGQINFESVVRDVLEERVTSTGKAEMLLKGAFRYFPEGLLIQPDPMPDLCQGEVGMIRELCLPFVIRRWADVTNDRSWYP